MIERINELMRKEGLSELQFAKRIGVPQSSVNGYLSGKNTPPTKFITNVITEFSDVSAEWLMRGNGSMYISDIPADGDSEQVLDLKAELMRKEGEVEGLRQTIADLKAAIAKREAQLDKLINILHEERQPSPSLSIVAEEPTYTNSNNLK